MEILTRDFGTIAVDEKDIIEFVQPIFGFEDIKRYVLICDDEIGSQFAWLQSVEESEICFILADPDLIDSKYKETIPEYATQILGEGACECWVIACIPDNFSDATVNLKSPIFIHTNSRTAAQVVLEQNYPIRCPMSDRKKGE